jgi:prepilin-type N-terminal cleavage/methylation domain-containing protein/prepilin-type processing-associated H-X9-DG protein
MISSIRLKSHRAVHRGFTLVELLVVIAIIAVLISILLPALARARDSAYTIQCSSNIRQILLMCQLYQNDNFGYLPAWDCGYAGDGYGSIGWSDNALKVQYRGAMSQIVAYTTPTPDQEPNTRLPPYFFCPSDLDPNDSPTAYDSRAISYGFVQLPWISAFGGNWTWDNPNYAYRAPKVGQIESLNGSSASDIGLIVETPGGAGVFCLYFNSSGGNPAVTGQQFGTNCQWDFIFRHNQSRGANAGFLDGHVESNSNYNTYAKQFPSISDYPNGWPPSNNWWGF